MVQRPADSQAAAQAAEKLLTNLSTPRAPGLHLDVPFGEYLTWDAASASQLEVLVEEPPAVLEYERTHPKTPTKAMRVGTLSHMAVLEPKRFEQLQAPKGKGASKLAKAKGDETVDAGEKDTACRIRDAIYAHPEAGAYFELAESTEVSIVWEYASSSGLLIPAKCRPDAIITSADLMVDLKTTTAPVNDRNISWTCLRFGYHRKAAWYLMAAKQQGLSFRQLVFVVISQKPPYLPRVVWYDASDLQDAAREIQDAANVYAECVRTGNWPGYRQHVALRARGGHVRYDDDSNDE